MMRERVDARCGFVGAGQTPELKKPLANITGCLPGSKFI
jgi:hypothetical protein